MISSISIIIPVYNTKDYLGRCLESIQSQSFKKNYEILLIDDGSTDGSKELCKYFAQNNSNIRSIHTENLGVCSARNTGIRNANGEYILFVDSDDILLPDGLKILYKNAIKYNSDISIGSLTSKAINKNDIVNGSTSIVVWDHIQGIKSAILEHPATFSACGKLIKNSILSQIKFKEGKKIHEDSFFVFECLTKVKTTVYQDIPVYRYIIRDDSSSHEAFSEKYFDIIFFALEKERIIISNYPQLYGYTLNMVGKAHMALLDQLVFANKKVYRSEIIKSRKYLKNYGKKIIIDSNRNKIRFFMIQYCWNPYVILKKIYRSITRKLRSSKNKLVI